MTVEKGYVKKAYLGERFAYRAYYNGQIIWDYTVDAIGTLVSELNAIANIRTESPTPIMLCADIKFIGNGMARTLEITPVFAHASTDIIMATKPHTVETIKTMGQLISEFQAIGAASTFGVVFTRGELDVHSLGQATPDTIDTEGTLCMTELYMDGIAYANDDIVQHLSLVSDGNICSKSTPKSQDIEKSIMHVESALNANACTDVLPVHTVTFMNEDKELYKTKIIHGYDCPDPVESGEIRTPTKAMTPQYTYEFSGWSMVEGGESSDETETVYAETQLEGFVYNESYGAYLLPVNPAPFTLTLGEVYTVKWDGKYYKCEAQDLSAMQEGAIGIGNFSAFGGNGNGETFIIGWNPNGVTYMSVTNESAHEIEITKGSALSNITQDTVVYAAFTESIRYYTVYFYDEDRIVDIVRVPYGGTATTNYMKEGFNKVTWVPSGENITCDTSCYGQFGSLTFEGATWDEIAEISESGQASDYFALGDTKKVSYNGGIIDVKIIGFDHDDLADGSGKAGITCAVTTLLSPKIKWGNSTTPVLYRDSVLHATLNSTVFGLLDPNLQSVIKSVLKECDNTLSSTYNGAKANVSAKLWPFSEAEMGSSAVASSNYTILGTSYGGNAPTNDSLLKSNGQSFHTRNLYRRNNTYTSPTFFYRSGGINRKNQGYDYIPTERNICFGFCI